MRARSSWVSPKCAIPAIIPAEIGQREKDFLRISDGARFEGISRVPRGLEQQRQFVVTAAYQPDRLLARNCSHPLHVESNDTTPRRGNVAGVSLISD